MPAPAAPADRLWQIDALRGLMLVLMTLTHLPTVVSSPAGQPFGFVSAAEGFVLLSGFMAGLVYSKRQHRAGDPAMREAFLRRALKIYLCQAGLLLFLFSVVALIAMARQEVAILNMLPLFIDKPLAALAGSLLLVHNPPLLDILPMYILFMLASPVLMVHGQHQGWGRILALSVALWLGAQFGLGTWLLHGVFTLTRLPLPAHQAGSFDLLAWQLLWVMGLWLGAQRAAAGGGGPPLRFPRWMLRCAIGIAVVGFVWRHAIGQAPFLGNPSLEILFDKWQLAPLRLIDLFALVVVAMHFEPWLSRHLPRARVLETLGAASLPVFCAHLVQALLALALFGEPGPDRGWSVDAAILGTSFVLLYAVALVSQAIDARAAAVGERIRARGARRSAAAGNRAAAR